MKRFLTILTSVLLVAASWSCEYDDENLWQAVNDLNGRVEAMEKAVQGANEDLKALHQLVEALQNNLTIAAVEQTAEGYTIRFSDGTNATITNGKDGQDGVNAPAITVVKDTDGCYYWALDGKIIEVDGVKIKAEGRDGITPQLRIHPDTKEWEMSTDGKNWQPLGVKAEGQDGDSIFTGVDTTTHPGFARFTLAAGGILEIPMANGMQLTLSESSATFRNGERKSFTLQRTGVEKITCTKPDGWRVSIEESALVVTAPVAENTFAENSGKITLIGMSGNFSCMAELEVSIRTVHSHTITFEGEEWTKWVAANFKPGALSTMKMGSPDNYKWVDATTQFTTGRPEGFMNGWGYPCFVSSYNSNSLDQSTYAGYNYDLYVYNPNGVEDSMKGGGRNGSDNFLVAYGYMDLEHPYGDGRPILEFADKRPRTIRSLFVNSTCYFYSVAGNGNALSPSLEKDVIFYATGYDAEGKETKTVQMVFGSKQGIIKEWTEWDLSELGPIVTLRLNQAGGADNGFGYSLPAYYAIDDVTVEWE